MHQTKLRPLQFIFLALTSGIAMGQGAPSPTWMVQYGTAESEIIRGGLADGHGGSWVVGYSNGAFPGPQLGGFDAFLHRYDENGDLLWATQWGNAFTNQGTDMSSDNEGGVLVTGTSAGNSQGEWNSFVRRYSIDGVLLWESIFGGDDAIDRARQVCPDGRGGAFVTGTKTGEFGGPYQGGFDDVFVARISNTGSLLWAHGFGSEGRDTPNAMEPDGAGGVFVGGTTDGSIGSENQEGLESHAFLAHYTANGNQTFARQWESNELHGISEILRTDQGELLTVSFQATPGLPGDIVLGRHGFNGKLRSRAVIGTMRTELALSAEIAGDSSIYLVGRTDGGLGGPGLGQGDIMLSKVTLEGKVLWATRVGTEASDLGVAMAIDPGRSITVIASTLGSLAALNAGFDDLALVRFEDI